MNDHLEDAAALAVTLADVLAGAPSERQRVQAAAHLKYMAGLLRGAAARRPSSTVTTWNEMKRQAASRADDRQRLTVERDRIHEAHGALRSDWRRIEKLVGREHTTPESVIDRVAVLAEQETERHRLEDELLEQRHEHAETAKELVKVIRHRDDLLRAARELDLKGGAPGLTGLRLCVQRIEHEIGARTQ